MSDIPEEVVKLLRQNKGVEAIALIQKHYFVRIPDYGICPGCGGNMRSDNTIGYCAKCQKNNRKLRKK